MAEGVPGLAARRQSALPHGGADHGPSSPVVASYRARPVAVDGTSTWRSSRSMPRTAGSRSARLAPPALPYARQRRRASARPDGHGPRFPGVAHSDSITVTSGVISTFVPDPLGHVSDPRFELETTARVAHGNSGGAAIDNAGQLIGVPSLAIPGEGGDVSWRLRSVAEATAADHRGARPRHTTARSWCSSPALKRWQRPEWPPLRRLHARAVRRPRRRRRRYSASTTPVSRRPGPRDAGRLPDGTAVTVQRRGTQGVARPAAAASLIS